MIATTPLTARQTEVLDWIRAFMREHGYSPSFRELAAGLGMANASGAAYAIDILSKKGYLTVRENEARTIRLIREDACPYCGAGHQGKNRHG